MSSKKVRNLFKFGRAKSQSTTDLSEWSKSDEKLMKAVEGNDVKKVSSILSKKALVPSKLGPRGHSIFHVACALGNPMIVDLLLKETEDVNDLTIQGNTCLQLAAAKGHELVVQGLIQSGADVDLRDSNDMAALHHACAGQHFGCVQFLLQEGADPRCVDKGGKTPLFFAAHRGEIGVCKLLVDKGADVNAGDKMQITPLMVAAREGNRDVCEFLLKRGANPNMVDREGHMALYYAMVAGHTDLREVFARAPTHASWNLNNTEGQVDPDEGDGQEHREGDGDTSSCGKHHPPSLASSQTDAVTTLTSNHSPAQSAVTLQSLATTKVESINLTEDSPSQHNSPQVKRQVSQEISPRSKDTQAYKELEAEHEQLSEEYNALSVENLRLRDKLEFLQQRMNGKHEQGKGGNARPPEVQDEIRNLKSLLEEEKERCQELENRLASKSHEDIDRPPEGLMDTDTWQDSEEDEDGEKSTSDVSDKQRVALLRSQILSLRQENDQLRNNAQGLHNGYPDSAAGKGEGQDSRDTQHRITVLEKERKELQAELLKMKETTASQQLTGAMGQEELQHNNVQLKTELDSLRSTMLTLEEEKSLLEKKVVALEEEKAAMPSDKVAVLNSAKVMEEVSFDEEGFVEGQDLTKEEFLQAQNEQLKVQCRLLTEELSKLRTTFDAILKAGDNLQSDYDQLQAEKDKLHDQLEVVIGEKEEVVKENEYLLSDGNALHEDLKKLVEELEKLQEKHRKVCTEKEQLQHQHNAVTIAGKVGEVARLLEEREKMQARLAEAEETAARLTHDQAILLEEVQSQQERVTALISERDALQAEMDDTEALVNQNEALTQEFTQLELDFNELLKEKQRLESGMQTAEGTVITETQPPAQPAEVKALTEEREQFIAEREQLELTIKELSRENATLEEELETLRTRFAEDGVDSTAQLELTIKELSKENAELEEELANVQEHMAELEADFKPADTTGNEVEALRASVSHLETTVTELSRENADLEEELAEVRRTGAGLSQQSVGKDGGQTGKDVAVILSLQAEKQHLEEQVQQLQTLLAQHPPVNGDMNSASSLSLHNNNHLKEEDQLLQTITDLQTKNSELAAELDSLRPVNGLLGKGEGETEVSKEGQSEELKLLKEQERTLQRRLADQEQLHAATISTYRTHLLSAVQGHMDPEVKEALHSIIEMRSMEQFC